MSFLTFRTNDAQREANANAFLHAYTLGAQSVQQQAEKEADAESQAAKLNAERAIETAKEDRRDARQKVTEVREEAKDERAQTTKALEFIAPTLKGIALNTNFSTEDRARAANGLNYITRSLGNLNGPAPDLSNLFVSPPSLTPYAERANTGKLSAEAWSGPNAALENKIKTAQLAKETAQPQTGDEVSEEALKDAAQYIASANTAGRIAGELKTLRTQRAAIDPMSLDPAPGKALDEAIKTKENELDAANKSLDMAHSLVLLQAQNGGFGPNVTKAANEMVGGLRVENPYDVKNHDYFGSYITGKLTDPALDANMRAGYSQLGSILNAGTTFQNYWSGPQPTFDSDPAHRPSSPMEDWKSHFDPTQSLTPARPAPQVTP